MKSWNTHIPGASSHTVAHLLIDMMPCEREAILFGNKLSFLELVNILIQHLDEKVVEMQLKVLYFSF